MPPPSEARSTTCLGLGKPLPKSADFDGQGWLREYVARAGGSPEDCLPTPLRLRKESERLAETIAELPTEQAVRAAVAELNSQIVEWRRVPLGPPIFVRLVDVDELLGKWQAARPVSLRVRPAIPPAKPKTRRNWLRRRSADVS